MNTDAIPEETGGTEVLRAHYGAMLGLKRPWRVETVTLDVVGKRLELGLDWEREGASQECPECGRACHLHDHAPEREWRHLDAMGFETVLRARVPRIKCEEHGVGNAAVPWALPHGRFTLAFEAMVIEVVKACASVQAACERLKLEWKQVHAIMERAVQRGLARRKVEDVKAVGFDEKSFKRGQSFISHLCDLRGRRILEVVEGRNEQSARALWQSLPEDVSSRIEDAVMDMSAGFAAAARIEAPQARITYDTFHVVSHLNKAVDEVRRAEHKELLAQGDEILKGQRMLFLFNPENLSEKRAAQFEALLKSNLKAGQAWAFKELFSTFWDHPDKESARTFIKQWCSRVKKTRLKSLKTVVKMIERHLEGLLNYFINRLTNALSEGFNSKIQQIKSAARGFRSFENYRIRILFFLGGLDLSVANGH
jgi:transposase